jgi:hypothetical protein
MSDGAFLQVPDPIIISSLTRATVAIHPEAWSLSFPEEQKYVYFNSSEPVQLFLQREDASGVPTSFTVRLHNTMYSTPPQIVYYTYDFTKAPFEVKIPHSFTSNFTPGNTFYIRLVYVNGRPEDGFRNQISWVTVQILDTTPKDYAQGEIPYRSATNYVGPPLLSQTIWKMTKLGNNPDEANVPGVHDSIPTHGQMGPGWSILNINPTLHLRLRFDLGPHVHMQLKRRGLGRPNIFSDFWGWFYDHREEIWAQVFDNQDPGDAFNHPGSGENQHDHDGIVQITLRPYKGPPIPNNVLKAIPTPEWKSFQPFDGVSRGRRIATDNWPTFNMGYSNMILQPIQKLTELGDGTTVGDKLRVYFQYDPIPGEAEADTFIGAIGSVIHHTGYFDIPYQYDNSILGMFLFYK